MPRRPPARLLRALAVGLLAAGLAGLLAATGTLAGFERDALDERYQVRGTHATPDVVVVGIDEDTLAVDFPFRRALHARAIRALLAADARAIAYDVQFSDARATARATRRCCAQPTDPRVVLGTAEVFRTAFPRSSAVERLQRQGRDRLGAHAGRRRRRLATPRRPRAGPPRTAVLAADGTPDAGAHPIDYAGPPGTVREIPFLDVLDGRFDRAAVRGRIVVVGATALTLQGQLRRRRRATP